MKRVLRWLAILVLTTALAGLAALFVIYHVVAPELPAVSTLREVQLQVPLRVYSADGKLMGLFGEMRRIPVTLAEIPDDLRHAFLAGEDARFYEHPGVDYQGISRAVWTLITTGEKSVGGSTITQQLARNFFLTAEKTFTRKFKEIFLALRIERELRKDEILELYLNKIFLGYRAYGVGAAAEVYYGKTTGELSLAQAAMIAALPKAPSRINPISNPERALERRDYVLGRMLELGYIDQAEHDAAVAEQDLAYYHGATAELSAPWVAEMARARAIELLGIEAYTGGFELVTTIDSRLQIAANEAVVAGLEDYDRRHGYRGPEARIDLADKSTPAEWNEVLEPFRPVSGLVPGLVTEVEDELAVVYLGTGQSVALPLERWLSPWIDTDRTGPRPKSLTEVLSPGDVVRARLDDEGNWRLAQVPVVEGALVSIDPRSGEVKALVGGYDFSRSKFNRVVQSRRQPGSGFKPFIYSAALDNGFTTASLINDAPIVFDDPGLERTWKPENFSEKFYGPTRMREAIVHSRNLVSIRLLRDVGIETARQYVFRFGFTPDELPRDLTLALGSGSVAPLSIARGFATFANGGFRVEPEFIRSIRDARGETVFETRAPILCDDCAPGDSLVLGGEPGEPAAVVPERPELRPLDLSAQAGNVAVAGVTRPGGPRVGDPQGEHYAERIISPQNAYLVRSMLMDVVRRGTGAKAMELGRADLAGKTGTTNEQRDAWFTGFNDHLVTTVWVGFDNHDPLGRQEVGGRAALPVWMAYMRVALEGVADEPPEMPEGLAQARIDPDTGLLAGLDNRAAIMEIFEVGRLPPLEADAAGEDQDVSASEDPYEIY